MSDEPALMQPRFSRSARPYCSIHRASLGRRSAAAGELLLESRLAREKHIEDAECEQRQPERGKAEETEPLRTLPDQFGVHDQIGRRCHQCQHPADQRGETQRHHKPAWRHATILRDAQHHRDENGDHSGGTHQGAEATYDRHQQDEQAVLTAAGLRVEPIAEPSRDAGPDQTFADDEQRGDQYNRWIGKPSQRFVHGNDAGEGYRNHHEERDCVHAGPADDEHHDCGREHKQDEGEIEVHQDLFRSGAAPGH
jgi:hypothetical protein